MQHLKSIGAVVAGFVLLAALSSGTDFVLQNKGIIPRDNLYVAWWLVVIVIAYRILYSIFGCYVTAWLAPSKPRTHALFLGVIGFFFSTGGALANMQKHLGPDWYPWTLVILSLPAAWLGGWLYEKKPVIVPEKTSAQTAPQQSMSMTRVMDATAQKVWMMWTKPEHFAAWFGTPPIAATPESTHMDVHVGGKWQADMINEKDGSRIPFGGTYLEIESQKRLVYTIEDPRNPENKEIVTITLRDVAGKTEMSLHQSGSLSSAEYNGPLQKSYGEFFDRMANHLMLLR